MEDREGETERVRDRARRFEEEAVRLREAQAEAERIIEEMRARESQGRGTCERELAESRE